jgi:hypothetical protein
LYWKTLPGPYPPKVDSLIFVIKYPDDLEPDAAPTSKDLRLFSSGGGSELIEWDLERSCILVGVLKSGYILDIQLMLLLEYPLTRPRIPLL